MSERTKIDAVKRLFGLPQEGWRPCFSLARIGTCAGDAYDVVHLMDPPVGTPMSQWSEPAVGPPPAGESEGVTSAMNLLGGSRSSGTGLPLDIGVYPRTWTTFHGKA